MVLRIGATAATSIDDLFEATIARPDRTMQWAFRERPVLCCIENGQDRHLVLDKSACHTNQQYVKGFRSKNRCYRKGHTSRHEEGYGAKGRST